MSYSKHCPQPVTATKSNHGTAAFVLETGFKYSLMSPAVKHAKMQVMKHHRPKKRQAVRSDRRGHCSTGAFEHQLNTGSPLDGCWAQLLVEVGDDGLHALEVISCRGSFSAVTRAVTAERFIFSSPLKLISSALQRRGAVCAPVR